MCGRFALYAKPQQIAEMYSAQNFVLFEPSYNIAPTQTIPVICELSDHERVLTFMRWGLVPSWFKEEKISGSMINARAETIESKPAYRNAIRQRRCLIVANGFYEWKHNGVKQPFYIHKKDDKPFAIAGIWERWVSNDRVLDSCSIITVNANKIVRPYHDRMPLIIHAKNVSDWLNHDLQEMDKIKSLFSSINDDLEVYPVMTMVNKVKYNNPSCIKPISN